MVGQRKRIWGWMAFDLAQQPYATLGLTFIFSPYFAHVAEGVFRAQGAPPDQAGAQAQSLWGIAQTLAGVVIALTAPFLGAYADASGRKLPWIAAFSLIYVPCAWALWFLYPDGTNLLPVLVLFWLGFIAGESALNLNNAQLPSLAPPERIGRISGSGAALGYWGGVAALFLMLLFLAENDTGRTLLGRPPAFGLDAQAREGTRSVGPFIAIWYVLATIPFFLWVRDLPAPTHRPSPGEVWRDLKAALRDTARRPSLLSFLVASMLYRDGLGALYSFGGIYATLVLGWSVIQIGVFGIVAAIAAAIITWAGGIVDQRLGPKPVILASCWALIAVCTVIVGVSREAIFGLPLAPGSRLPDLLFYLCGALIGGAGGAIYSASRTLMVRHADPERAGEAFGLFALTGRATAFLAPALIAASTAITGSTQLGFVPVILLFLVALRLLAFVRPQGDRAP
ncbi:membrane protein [Rubellimicrobium mesophilum DSM 19309]|uniref:Membrane protein n=1 Tax=Rubellimicrobium mesophilum DSM 19309 TaxID=442562 RepID=A0A017HM45_9RHOB|nr:MFS transporter [Rubellimicrobium mesophilum]EYD74859.1 membrane protein [Rubellimicrobium mesophilum DSM 19309]